MASLCPDVAYWGGAPTLATNLQRHPIKVHQFRKIGTSPCGTKRIEEVNMSVGGARGQDSFGPFWLCRVGPVILWSVSLKVAGVGVVNTLHSCFCKTLNNISF